MTKQYTKWSLNISKFSHSRPFKIYPNWGLGVGWYENIPSGNPASEWKEGNTGRTVVHYSEVEIFLAQ
jgi:hypothetical protein